MTPTFVDPALAPINIEALLNPAPLPPAAEPQPKQAPKLPADMEIKNYSQARRLCLHMFGPLVRLRQDKHLNEANVPEPVFQIQLGSAVFGTGATWKEAIEVAMDLSTNGDWEKELAPYLMPTKGHNVTTAMRMALANQLPSSYPKEEQGNVLFGVLGLYDHQLFEVIRLNRETVEGKIANREAAALALKKMLDAGNVRFKKLSRER